MNPNQHVVVEMVREDLRTVELVRKATGDAMTIMVDANQAQSSGNWQPECTPTSR